MQTRTVHEPRKYLTALLKKRLKSEEAEKGKQPQPAVPRKFKTYFKPILFSLNGAVYSKSLRDLVDELALPPAGWHKLKAFRRRMFEKALKSMGTQKTTDGRQIILGIEEGLTDWLLTARLEGEGKCLEVQSSNHAGQQ